MSRAPVFAYQVRRLTVTEEIVAKLAAAGMSNRQVADQLSISRKAVEYHLTNTYLKLGISGRGGLWEALGLPPICPTCRNPC